MADPTSRTTAKMQEAIRIGCTAADVHLRCSYPDCTCTQIPKAISAAVKFAIRDAANGFKVAMVEEAANRVRR